MQAVANVSSRWPLGRGARIVHALCCVVAFEIFQVLSMAVAFVALGLAPADLWSGHPGVIASTVISGTVVMVGLVWLGVVRLGRVSWDQLGWHARGWGQSVGLGLVGLVLLVGILVGLLAGSGALAQIDLLTTVTGYTAAQRLLFLVLGIAAATTEESLFRGYLQPALVAKVGLVGGVVIGAAVFSLYHIFMGPSPYNLFGKFLFGLVLGALRGRDRSLIAPWIAHFLFWQVMGSV